MNGSADTAKERKDASQAFSYSEQHRLECEARYVLAKKLSERREYLAGVEKARGLDGRKYLEAEVRRQWEAKRRPGAPGAAGERS